MSKKKNKQQTESNPTAKKGMRTDLHHSLMGKEYYAGSFPEPSITNIGK